MFEERQVKEPVRKFVKKKILPVKKEPGGEAFFEYLSKSEINLVAPCITIFQL